MQSDMLGMPFGDHGAAEALRILRQELSGGLLYTHSRANANTSRILEAAAFLYALIDLDEKGIITIAEADVGESWPSSSASRSASCTRAWASTSRTSATSITCQKPREIDCAARIELCGPARCRMWFPLSRQDIDQGHRRDCSTRTLPPGKPGLLQASGRGLLSLDGLRPSSIALPDVRLPHRRRIGWISKRIINPDLESLFQDRQRGKPDQ